MQRVATLCVAASVAVMTVALGVVNGFRTTIEEKIAGFAADIQIAALGNGSGYEMLPVVFDSALVREIETEVPGVERVQRFAAKTGIVRGDESIQGIVLRGLGPESDTAFLHRQLVAGRIPTYSDTVRNRDAVISESLSRSMRLGLGDRFELLFVGDEAPRRDRLRVAGIYRSGMEEFDRMTVFGDLGVVQRLNGWGREQIGGYEILLAAESDAAEAARAADRILDGGATDENEEEATDEEEAWDIWTTAGATDETTDAGGYGQRLVAATVAERYPQIFDWLAMLRLNTTIVIVIMLAVAVVNMASGVLIGVLEQTRTIGILKALGMENGPLQRTFVLRSVGITLRGLLWGNLAGLTLCLVQQYTGIVALDPENYMMAAVPVRIDWGEILALNLGTLAVVTLAMGLPTAIVARIAPEQSIRFQ
ncbi:MAG: ABC transporter permease [Rikenella sp.]|nr:ABC transporter permease [Rikenella sp.]